MKTESVLFINWRKLTKRRKKALFLIIPLGFLVAMAVLVSSQVANFQKAADTSIFGTINEQSKAIYLDKTAEQGFARPGSFFNSEDSQFSEADLESIENLEHVTAAALNQAVPISNLVTTDLFAGTEVSLASLVGLNSEIASLYTDQSFDYQAGEPIPIILNASSFVESYEDWGGQDSITITMRRGTRSQPGTEATTDGADPREAMQNQLPFKTRSIDYDKDSLIGQEFTLQVGGLDELETYDMSFTTAGQTISKLTIGEIEDAKLARQTALSTYWDYNQLATPQTYTFKVVGVINDGSNFNTYIPASFTSIMMQAYIQNQLEARNETALVAADLNSTFKGLTYDGLELASALGSGFGIMGGPAGGMGRPGETTSEASESYNVPGLVVEIDRDSDDVIGEYLDPIVYNEAVETATSAIAVIDNVDNRDSVVAAINDLGFSLTDKNNLAAFDQIQTTLTGVTWGLSISVVVLAALLISFTMGKFVSDSRKEIGIFRALGMTKGNIRNLFVNQTALYAGLAYMIGAVFGILLILVTAAGARSWFESFLAGTMEQTFSVVNPVSSGTFMHLDWLSFILYSILILGVAILISLIPASKAARIDPVQAIKEE